MALTELAIAAVYGAKVISTIGDVKKQIVELVHGYQDKHTMSLSERAKAASIYSRVFVDSLLVDDEIMVPLIGALNQLYASYVFTALGLSSYIDSSRTVGDITRTVSTESLYGHDSLAALSDRLGVDIEISMEAAGAPQAPQKFGSTSHMGASVVELTPGEQHLIAGRLIEMSVIAANGASVPIRIHMQLVPRIIPSNVLLQYVGLASPVDKDSRKMKVKSGEIRFWRDFIFEVDRNKQLRKALSQDKTGTLRDMIARQSNSLTKYWMNVSSIQTNYNSASGVMIMDHETYRAIRAEGLLNLDRMKRDQFFKQSLLLFLVVVDRDSNIVHIYTHGIEEVGDYSYRQIEKVGASSKGMNMKDVMTMFGRGSAPRI